jgi:Bacterial-like globin
MIDQLYDLIGGKKTVWAATATFYNRVLADDTLRLFLKILIWPDCAKGRACFSPCCWGDESSMQVRISRLPMPM